jgi:hypothetical protein
LRKDRRRQVDVTRGVLPIRLSYRLVIKILNGGGKESVYSAVGLSGSDRGWSLLTAELPVSLYSESSEQCMTLAFGCGLRTVMFRRFVVIIIYSRIGFYLTASVV